MNDAILSPLSTTSSGRDSFAASSFAWISVSVGLLLLYVPAYIDVARIFWVTEDGAHGPLFMVAFVLLVYQKRAALLTAQSTFRSMILGWLLVLGAVPMYVVGRSQEFYQAELGSQLPLLCGVVLLMSGAAGLRQLRLPIILLMFVVPLPGSLLDSVLLPLKEVVSNLVSSTLFTLGFPIAHDGVVLFVGPYQLLIANACSGLNSMISLTAIGLLYIHLSGHRMRWANLALLSAAVPIAFIANVLRVCALVLLTYYFGDAFGRSFHAVAAYVEILIAFASFFMLDAALAGMVGVFARRRREGLP